VFRDGQLFTTRTAAFVTGFWRCFSDGTARNGCARLLCSAPRSLHCWLTSASSSGTRLGIWSLRAGSDIPAVRHSHHYCACCRPGGCLALVSRVFRHSQTVAIAGRLPTGRNCQGAYRRQPNGVPQHVFGNVSKQRPDAARERGSGCGSLTAPTRPDLGRAPRYVPS
jgi:hypothetical protein